MSPKTIIVLILLIIILGLLIPGYTAEAHLPRVDRSRVQEIKIPTKNVTLHAKIVGNLNVGDVLIAVNGGPGQSSRYMASLEQLVSAKLAVVTYDQRGAGQSTEPSDGYELLNYVADLEAVREAVGAEKIHILGHSWGGIVAIRYATVHPQRVRSIILMGSGPPSREAVQAGQARLGQRIARLQEQGIIAQSLPVNTKHLIEAILPAYYSDPEFKIPKELKETAFNETAYQQTLAAIGNWDFKEEVAKLTHPVLMLWGENDPFGLPMAEATRNALSNAQVEFVVLKGCGHYWQECPDEFFSHIRAFLKHSFDH